LNRHMQKSNRLNCTLAGSAPSFSASGSHWKRRTLNIVMHLKTGWSKTIDLPDAEYIEVNPYHKPQSLLDLNPRGLVPTLQYQNKPLYESTVLCEFLEDAFPDRPPHLLPKDPYDRARTRIWTDYVGSRIIPAYHRFLQHQGQDGLKEKQQDFLDHLKEFTKEMDPEGPYFMGKEFSLIDIVIAPWANRLWVFDHFKGGSGLPEEGQGGDDEKTWSRWRTWLKAVESRKSVRETLSDREHYLPIYQRYG
jgi:glutathione S-transferase